MKMKTTKLFGEDEDSGKVWNRCHGATTEGSADERAGDGVVEELAIDALVGCEGEGGDGVRVAGVCDREGAAANVVEELAEGQVLGAESGHVEAHGPLDEERDLGHADGRPLQSAGAGGDSLGVHVEDAVQCGRETRAAGGERGQQRGGGGEPAVE